MLDASVRGELLGGKDPEEREREREREGRGHAYTETDGDDERAPPPKKNKKKKHRAAASPSPPVRLQPTCALGMVDVTGPLAVMARSPLNVGLPSVFGVGECEWGVFGGKQLASEA